jgi:uncharacterized protein
LIFGGPVIERIDARKDYGGIRVRAIGAVGADILLVIYTDRKERRRIISARLANQKEREEWRSFANL